MAPTWLDQLPSHPIFILPAVPSSSSSSTSQLPPPASPGLSSIFSPTTSTSKSSLSSRSLFGQQQQQQTPTRTKRTSSSVPSTARKAQPEPTKQDGPQRQSKMVLSRGTDLLVAVGSEVRIASLSDVKGRASAGGAAGKELGEYKTLDIPAVNFEIHQLVLNPTCKLLAVVGLHSVAVIVLPRKGWSSSLSHSVACRSLTVGKFYHALVGSPPVAQVLWHPWGEAGYSLLVLTVDCVVREYSIAIDVEEPSQTLSFSPSSYSHSTMNSNSTPRGGKRFSADDQSATVATSMCLGEGAGDWGPLTLYGLMRNGDVYALSPFLPRRVEIPPAYVHALSVFVASKVDYLALSSASLDSPSSPRANTSSSSTSLFASTSTPTKSNLAVARHGPSTPRSRAAPPQREEQEQEQHRNEELSKMYNLQLIYVNSLVRSVAHASSHSTSSSSVNAEEADPDNSMDLDAPPPSSTPVSIITPLNRPAPPALQGPFLLQPAGAGEELDNGVEESRACDLVYLSYSGRGGEEGEGEGGKKGEDEDGEGQTVGVMAMVWSDGRLDLMLEVEKVEGRFAVPSPPTSSSYASPSARSTSSAAPNAQDAPTLLVYETIDLGLASEIVPPSPSSSSLTADDEAKVDAALLLNYPTLTIDPLYPDTLYVSHCLGAHCVAMGGWLEGLLAASRGEKEEEEEDEEAELKRVERAIRSSEGSSVGWVLKTRPLSMGDGGQEEGTPVEGVALVNDVYLGYSLLLLTRELQLVAIELSLRVDSSLLPSSSTPKALDITSTDVDNPSLLAEPFSMPSILSSRPSASTALARLAPPKLPPGSSNSKELTITPETLRYLGKTVELVQGGIRELVDAADGVQVRLELQMKELGRQLRSVEELSRMGGGGGRSKEDGGDLSTRLAEAQKRQLELLGRTDRLLQKLMDAHSPTLSTFEKKWFAELERLKVEEGKLGERVRRVEGRAEELRPGLERLKMKQGGEGKKEERGTLGEGQVKKLEGMLVKEAKLIAEARRKVDRLSHALASSSLS